MNLLRAVGRRDTDGTKTRELEQGLLLEAAGAVKSELMEALEKINKKMGRGTLGFASERMEKRWQGRAARYQAV